MATFRVGIGSFNIQDGAVGFGTDTDGLGNLKVKGVTKTTDIKVSGASTLTRYSGFAADNINQLENITFTSEVGTIGDIVVGVGTSVIISSASTVTVGTVESVSIGTHFSPPVGGIEERGDNFIEGMMRFNTDLNTMEFYNGNEWRQFTYISDIQNSPSSRGRGLFAAGYRGDSEVETDIITYVEVSTLGNALNFGNLSANGTGSRRGGCSNGTRGLAGGAAPGNDYIDYLTIASEGNSIDFGNLTVGRYNVSSCSSSTRGVWMAGYVHPSGDVNTIDYVQIATLGNALDFGDTTATENNATATASPTRGFCFGFSPFGAVGGVSINMITFASLGNAIDFGDGSFGFVRCAAGSNNVRALIAGRQGPSSAYRGEMIQEFNMASGGNAENFGELTTSRGPGFNAITNATRAVWGGGFTNPSQANMSTVMDFALFETSGNAISFGDMGIIRDYYCAINDTHGGLGGY